MQAEKSVLLPISPDDAFALLTQPDRLRRWKTVSARVDLRAGGEYRWTVVPGNVAAGTYTEVEPGRRIVFGWGWEGSPDLGPDASTVTITFEPADGGTLVRLVHDGLTPEQAASHLAGWNHFFERLERAATIGDAGADEWAAVPVRLDPLTAADAALAVCQLILRGVSDDDLDRPTPCSDLTVRQLAEHLIGSVAGLGEAAGATAPAIASASLESQVAVVAQRALEAWHARGLDGSVTLRGAHLPAAVAVNLFSVEFLIHAWDFAAATEQRVIVSGAVTDYVLDLAREVISPQTSDDRSLAEAIEAGPDADVVDRLTAFSGRAAA